MKEIDIRLIKIIIWFFWVGSISLDDDVISLKIPCAEIISLHPESRVFCKWCAVCIGVVIMFWVERGVKYHIEQEASWFLLCLRRVDGEEFKVGIRAQVR